MLGVDLVESTPRAKPSLEVDSPVDKPPSPCFDIPVMYTEDDSKALQMCQRMVIENYCQLCLENVFHLGLFEPLSKDSVLKHPIQDPTGALTVALLIIRRHRPALGCFMEPPYDMNLKTDVRRGLAAVMCVAHKLTAHTCTVGVEIYVQRIMQKFLLLSERPKWNADWAAEYEWHLQAELSVLAEPIMSLHTCNPLSEAEVEIGQLVASGKISSNDAMVMRGSCFFLVGACMLNPEKDVLETLAVRMSTTDIGCGVVSLLLTLMHTLGDPYGGFRLKRGEVLYRAPYNRNVDNAAQVMLCNATSGHANQLRVGPYRPAVQARQGAGPVQRIVDADNLMKANEVFKECMVPVS